MNKSRGRFLPMAAITSACAAALTFNALNSRVNWIAARHSLEGSSPQTFECTIASNSYFQAQGSTIVKFWGKDRTMQLEVAQTTGTFPWMPMGSTQDEQREIPSMVLGPARTWPATDVIGEDRLENLYLDAKAPLSAEPADACCLSFLFSFNSPSGPILSIGLDNIEHWWDDPTTANFYCRPVRLSR